MKRIYRSEDDRLLAGVCGGLGEHFDVDPTIVRIVWVALTLFGFTPAGVVLYILAWLLIHPRPMEDLDD